MCQAWTRERERERERESCARGAANSDKFLSPQQQEEKEEEEEEEEELNVPPRNMTWKAFVHATPSTFL